MPLIETKGAASAQGFGLTLSSGAVPYIEDVFSTYLYTGNSSSSNPISNGIDLAGKGGLVWLKTRSYGDSASSHVFTDTVRGGNKVILSNSTAAEVTTTAGTNITSFNSSGFTLGNTYDWYTNYIFSNQVSWTFRKQPKFFDIVTYTGNGVAGRTVAHNLGSTPGCMIIKKTNSVGDWYVYHRSLTSASFYLLLNSTDTQNAGVNLFNSTAPTDSVFTLGSGAINTLNDTYVAYLFAHNAGGFGLSGTDNVITCGTYTGNGLITGPAITLDYEPQFLLIKSKDGSTGNWYIFDVMRGFSTTSDNYLYANSTSAELSGDLVTPTSTGFQLQTSIAGLNASGSNYIYIAIRRGPMKVPTSGTSVFAPVATTNDGSPATTNFPVDLFWDIKTSGATQNAMTMDRLRWSSVYLATSSTIADTASGSGGAVFTSNTTVTPNFYGSTSSVIEAFRRAPGFFDVVCYTGTGVARTVNHNLGVAPQLIIVKARSATWPWPCYVASLGNNKMVYLNTTASAYTVNATYWNSTNPTASVFSLGTDTELNAAAGTTYVAYLFATCAGVSKVGSYTGTGANQTIDCGFTGGARFVLIRRTDSTGDWYVYDSARGFDSSTNSYLLLNSTAAEVTGTIYVVTTSVGFQVRAGAPSGLNANGGTYIFLAIA